MNKDLIIKVPVVQPSDDKKEIKIGRCIIVDYGHIEIVDPETNVVEQVLPRYAVWDTHAGVVDRDGSDDPKVLYERYKKYDPQIVLLEDWRDYIDSHNLMRKWYR